MKQLKHLYSNLAAGIITAAVSSCDVHEFPVESGSDMPPTEIILKFDDADMPVLTTVEYDSFSRSIESEHDARYIIHVYPEDYQPESRTPTRAPLVETIISDRAVNATDDRIILLNLDAGSYRILVFSDYTDSGSNLDKYHDTGDLSEIKLISADGNSGNKYIHQGNTRYREVFRGEQFVTVSKDGNIYHSDGSPTEEGRAIVYMMRPQARFAFVTTDMEEFASVQNLSAPSSKSEITKPDPDDYRVVIRYTSYMPSTYNAYSDKPTNSRTGVYFEGGIEPSDNSQASLGSDHVFVNGNQTSVQVALDIYSRKDGSLIGSTNPIDVPLKRNHLTLIKGQFLTTKSGNGVGIDPGYFDEFNIEIL